MPGDTAGGSAAGIAWESANYVVGNCVGGDCYGDIRGGLMRAANCWKTFKSSGFSGILPGGEIWS